MGKGNEDFTVVRGRGLHAYAVEREETHSRRTTDKYSIEFGNKTLRREPRFSNSLELCFV